MVAGLASTFLVSEADAYQLFEKAGLSQIGAQVTLPAAWNSPVSYEFSMGGVGTLLADMPALKSIGVKKFAVMPPGQRAVGGFHRLRVSAGQEPRHAAGRAHPDPCNSRRVHPVRAPSPEGRRGRALGLPGNVAGQIIDAMNSLNSDLKAAASWGTFSQKAVQEMPENIAKNFAFTDAVPPFVNSTPAKWPIQEVMVEDFKASGKANLERDSLNVEPVSQLARRLRAHQGDARCQSDHHHPCDGESQRSTRPRRSRCST